LQDVSKSTSQEGAGEKPMKLNAESEDTHKDTGVDGGKRAGEHECASEHQGSS
jgi:hypothetical protein